MSHRISRAPCGPWAPATNTARDMMVIATSSASNPGIVARAANVFFFILFMSFCLSFPGGHNLGFESCLQPTWVTRSQADRNVQPPSQPGSCELFVQPGDCVQTEDTSLFTQ